MIPKFPLFFRTRGIALLFWAMFVVGINDFFIGLMTRYPKTYKVSSFLGCIVSIACLVFVILNPIFKWWKLSPNPSLFEGFYLILMCASAILGFLWIVTKSRHFLRMHLL